MLVGADVDHEDERVVVFDLLHGGLGRERMLDDGERVQLAASRSRLARVPEVVLLRTLHGELDCRATTASLHRTMAFR